MFEEGNLKKKIINFQKFNEIEKKLQSVKKDQIRSLRLRLFKNYPRKFGSNFLNLKRGGPGKLFLRELTVENFCLCPWMKTPEILRRLKNIF